MGMSCMSKSTSTYSNPPPAMPNPDPRVFEIVRSQQVQRNLAVAVKYPSCVNYEGLKVLAYLNCTLEDLLRQGTIDPHFSDNPKMISPFARFEPTVAGWDAALHCCEYQTGS